LLPSPPLGGGIGSAFWVVPQQLLPQQSQQELQQSHLLRWNKPLSLSRQLSFSQQQSQQLDWQQVVGQQVVQHFGWQQVAWQQVVGQQLVQQLSQHLLRLKRALSLSRQLSFSQQQSQQLDWQQLVWPQLDWQQLVWPQLDWQQVVWQHVVGQQLVQQLSQQQSLCLNRFINFCRQPSFSQQQSQVLQHEPQPPQHELAAAGAGAAGAAAGAASAPISQAVVTNKNAAFTSNPPFRSNRGARPRGRGRDTSRHGPQPAHF
jgi:hypothetical protein